MKYYGGQALIEGVMMRGKHTQANAIRLESGEIICQVEQFESILDKYPLLKIPFIRGTAHLLESLYVGMKALTWSTDMSISENEEEGVSPLIMCFSIGISLIFGILLFFMLPVGLSHLFSNLISSSLGQNILEGGIRVGIFLCYLLLISQMKEIKRVFAYHGAEHKTIHCYEKGLALTPENAKQFTTLHPRCGTSFLFLVMIISILVFAFAGVDNLFVRFLSRVVLLPVVAGLSYEVLKFTGKYSNKRWVKCLSLPGLYLQKLTTREPDEQMLEVAIVALEKVLEVEEIEENKKESHEM